MPGPPPKDPRTRQRRNRVSTAGTVKAGARAKGKFKPLPKRRGGWHARTVAWWRELWTGELEGRFLGVDFYPLLRLAELWDDYHHADGGARLELAKELRLQESRWPLDEMARRSLQVEVERDDEVGGKRGKAADVPLEEAVDPRGVLRAVK